MKSATLMRGSLCLSQEMYQEHLAGVQGVVLQRRGGDLLVLPVRHTPAGGFLLKQRNSRGDRVVSAADFFREHDLDDDKEIHASVRWDEAAAGLVLEGLFRK